MDKGTRILARILERLSALHPKKIDLSLGRMERLLEALGRPQDKLAPVFHVAGTNGKGSTVAFLRAMLEAADLRVHVYTSPHLVNFNERIRLGESAGGRLIAPNHLTDVLERCESANGDAPITFFEITTAAAFLAFAETPADAVILEVGLGGRLDATNVVTRPLVTAIAPVSLDHREYLGADIAAIAREKAGIAREGCPLITAPQPPVALRAIEGIAAAAGSRLLRYGPDWEVADHGGDLYYRDGRGDIDLPPPALQGSHQFVNAGLAIACLRHQNRFAVPPEAMARGLETVDWPARFQDITSAPGLVGRIMPGAKVWLDGGHNPAAGAALAEVLRRQGGDFVLIAGLMANKEAAGFLAPLAPHANRLIAVPIAGEACHDPENLTTVAGSLGLPATTAADVSAALDGVGGVPRILICGSLYLAGQVLGDIGLPPT
ncbi:MAG: folylpolyglutamate synthase/dihydrofolate synthase family protein [Sphingomonadales bacterium]